MSPTEPDARAVPRRLRGRTRSLYIGVIALVLVAVIAFPVWASLRGGSTGRVSIGPSAEQRHPKSGPAGRQLQSLPAFTPHGTAGDAVAKPGLLTPSGEQLNAALTNALGQLFGAGSDGGLGPLLKGEDSLAAEGANHQISTAELTVYPFRFPAVEQALAASLGGGPLKPSQVDAANDLAGLLMIAAARPDLPSGMRQAPSVAFALLARARTAQPTSCRVQLNLGFLLSTNVAPRDDDTAAELERAAANCPGDPTPLWLLGQFQSGRSIGANDTGQPLTVEERRRRPFDTFHRLEAAFPRSPLGYAGEADANLRIAYDINVPQPFTARAMFRRAEALYQEALTLPVDSVTGDGLRFGLARAYAGEGEVAKAAATELDALRDRPDAAIYQVHRVDYLERLHDFGGAASEGRGFLDGPSNRPTGLRLYPSQAHHDDTAKLPSSTSGELADPLSIGAADLLPVNFDVGPPVGGAGNGVSDFSFIPAFRPDGLTDTGGWCREFSYRRDLLLADEHARVLKDLPESFHDTQPSFDYRGSGGFCGEPEQLAALAKLAQGDSAGAVAAVRSSSSNSTVADDLARLRDTEQNIWRFAGDLKRAARSVDDWIQTQPRSSLARDRAGEISFLKGDFAAAAGQFASAGARSGGLTFATETLKEGTALELTKDYGAAQLLLKQADEVSGERADAPKGTYDANVVQEAVYLSYHARLQAGDTGLRSREYAAAARHYTEARQREAQLDPLSIGDFVRPEVLENNEALVQVKLGHLAKALDAAKAALAYDPESSIFLQNMAWVERRAGDPEAAERHYRAALESDPTNGPAANDLGVLSLESKKMPQAVAAFRQAIASDHRYATAMWNLGIAHGRMSVTHFPQAQAELAAAIRQDRRLADREREPILDEDLYFTTLDLSKPIPAKWNFAHNSQRLPVTVGVLALLLVLVGGGTRHVTTEKLSDLVRERAVKFGHSNAVTRFATRQMPVPVAVIGTAIVLVYPLARSKGTRWFDWGALGICVLLLVSTLMCVRGYIAHRRGGTVRHFTWTPSLLIGFGAAAAGLGYAPVPAAEHRDELRRMHWIGPALLAALTLLILLVGHLTRVPLTRTLGECALVMLASVLTPVLPYDGFYLKQHRHVVLIGVAALILAFLVGARII